jgi:hypothetical protein
MFSYLSCLQKTSIFSKGHCFAALAFVVSGQKMAQKGAAVTL